MTGLRRLNNRAKALSIGLCAFLLVISGCPSEDSAVNWPSERLDSHPSLQPVALKVHDMDNDGLKDVISIWRGSSATPGAVAIHFHAAGGGFGTVTVQANAKYAKVNGINIADVNLDGRPDIVVAAHDRIVYLRSPVDPHAASEWTSFDITSSIATDSKAWFDVAAVQIDGVHGLDIVATLNDAGRLVWFRSPENPDAADGWTISSIDSTTRAKADSLAIVDMNSDGRPDVVCSATGDTNGEISWYEHPLLPAASAWTKHVMTTLDGASRFSLGDLDGDGLADLAAVSPQSRRVAWFPHPQPVTGVWNGWVLADYTKIATDKREPVDVVIADMDGNGTNDVVVANDSPASLFYYTPGTDNRLRWTEHRIAGIADLAFGLFAVDDTDGDGLPELIVPVDQLSDDTLDRIDRFINPLVGSP